jgi:quinol monooxygenase YgiN
MSVIMTLLVQGDPKKMEEFAAANKDRLHAIADKAKEHGVIAHRFYGSEGQIMVIDEWPDAESFQRFFEDQRSEIEPMMEAVGAQGEPTVNFWRKLETDDEIGWES